MADMDFIKELNEVVSEDDSKIKKINKSRKNRKALKIVFIVILAVVAIAVIAGLRSETNLVNVQGSTLMDYPNATVGDAFEGFFGSPQWGVDKDGDQHYVTFKGQCEFVDGIADVEVIFWVGETQFGISSMTMDGVELNDLQQTILLNAIYGV